MSESGDHREAEASVDHDDTLNDLDFEILGIFAPPAQIEFPMGGENIQSDGQSHRYELRVQVLGNQLRVAVRVHPALDLPTALNQALTHLDTGLAAISFTFPGALEYAATHVISEDRLLSRGGPFPQLRAPAVSQDEVLTAMNSAPIGDALREFAAAVRWPNDTAFHAYRGVEILRSLYSDAGEANDRAWESLHRALRTTKQFFAPLVTLSEQNRHGERHLLPRDNKLFGVGRPSTEQERRVALEILLTTIERAILHHLHGDLRDDLPLLVDPPTGEPIQA